LLVVVGILVYSNTFNVPFYFDDLPNVSENRNIHISEVSASSLLDAWRNSPNRARPVANISFALNYYFHQDAVMGYHVVNLLIHITTGILLFLLVSLTLSLASTEEAASRHRLIAFSSTLLWLVHPLQTQSVTYIVQRMNSMAAMFFILALLLYVRGRLTRGTTWTVACFAGSILAGIAALGCKQTAATLPAFVLLYEWFFFQQRSTAWIKRRIGWLAGAALVLAATVVFYLGKTPVESILAGYRYRDFSLAERVLTESRVVTHYIGLLFFPHPSRLTLVYDFPLSRSLLEPLTTFLSASALTGLLLLAVFLSGKNRLLSFCILWFLGNLAIESSVIGLEIIFEHRVYLPSMFFCVLLTVLVYRYTRSPRVAALVLAAVAVVFSYWTFQRNELWKDPVAFWADNVEKAEQVERPRLSLGKALRRQGKIEEALDQYRRAIEIEPTSFKAHYNVANVLSDQQRTPEALEHYQEAVRLDPEFVPARYNLANALLAVGRPEQALSEYRETVRLDAQHHKARNNLGAALLRLGRIDEAIQHYREVISMGADVAETYRNLAMAYEAKGMYAEAIENYRAALQRKPDLADARENLAKLREREQAD
jgi:Flp pilus assembly protein TadD